MLSQEVLLEKTEGYLKSRICEASTSLNADFESTAPFGELGIDSFRVLKIIKSLENDFGALPKTLLFEHFNVSDLARYFVDKHDQALAAKFATQTGPLIKAASRTAAPRSAARPALTPAHVPALPPTSAPGAPAFTPMPGAGARTSGAAARAPEVAVPAPASGVVSGARGVAALASGTAALAPSIAAPAPPAIQSQSLRLLEKDLPQHPELAEQIRVLSDNYKNDGGVSRGTRNIAPNLFISCEKRGYFNYARSKDAILVYAYTGPRDFFPVIAQEMAEYCAAKNFQLNLFVDEPIDSIGGARFTSTPFGALQRVLNIQDFTLEGGAMRRLRYQVSRFEKSGVCRTEEYRCGTRPEVDRDIARVIDDWCASKPMVNPLIHIVKEEILAGALDSQHRLFLTYVDDGLQNVILITPLSSALNGYLMDLEFYGPSMPLGGLEYAIVKMIEKLAAEGCGMLSLGGTYGCRLETCANADPEIDRMLDDLHKQNIFNDEGNLQFKNKFRPENRTIYLCRPVGVGSAANLIDIIMMIADPATMQTPDTENHNVEAIAQPAACIEDNERSRALEEFGFNPLNIPNERIEIDLKTDSWAQLKTPFVERHMRNLRSQLQQNANLKDSLQAIFPFKHFILTTAGRTAEELLCQAFPKKGVVLQNLLFPSGIYHQIDKGFTPLELPHPEVFELHSREPYKANLAWDALREQVEQQAEHIAFVCIEVSDNAAGGHPVSVPHLRRVKELLTQHSIPLVIDATRILENARYLVEHEQEYAGKTLWAVTAEILSFADVIVGSLCKDFCVDKGGLVATNDTNLFRALQDKQQEEGGALDAVDKKVIALSLQNRRQIEAQVVRRVDAVKSIWSALKAERVPVVEPVGGHCVLIDVKQIAEVSRHQHPVASFLAWLYLNTGIRAGAHSAGMQKNSALNGLVRLAIPVGLKSDEVQEIVDRLTKLFRDRTKIPELVTAGGVTDSIGEINARYKLSGAQAVPAVAVTKAEGPCAPQRSAVASRSNGAAKLPELAGHAEPAAPAEFAESAESAESAECAQLAEPAECTQLAESAQPVEPAASAKSAKSTERAEQKSQTKDIAIIGMAGRYPQARNLHELWINLRDGKDCIEEIPEQRLATRALNAAPRRYRGGFVSDVDKFDSLFFNISPREAELLDPQDRLFLETAWEAIEDAGYYPEILANKNTPRNIGVFVGAVWTMYQVAGVEAKLAGHNVNPNSFLWSIANRVSYWMNLTGPSLTVDTACSSSLTALHLACEAVQRGECSAALVGGVNLDLHQHKFDINDSGGALSRDGVCRSFGAGANGYVAGEGVGAILIKPLDQAIADRDNIYGVIKSTVVNHGGRTSGYTVPNPKAQSALIQTALAKASVDPRSIGYIEAHGTGTELGDPIEISGLTSAFAASQVEKQSCPIGSVKTNIGHLEAAAGVVSVCKVLLQMRHRKLAPSLHSSELNALIDFKNSPFYVVQRLEDWQPKQIDGQALPLRAGISSFGAGGANAHVILEQYEQVSAQPSDSARAHIFPLSARSEEQLREMAQRLRDRLEFYANGESTSTRPSLDSVAFTLQKGRKGFEHRLAIVASTHEALIEKLSVFLSGKQDADVLSGRARGAEGIARMLSRKEKEQFVELLSQSGDVHKIAQLWIEGLLEDLGARTGSIGCTRVPLPTYPFADKRHWIGTDGAKAHSASRSALPGPHPLIDSNESTFQRQLFKKTFHAREFFLADHVVSGIPTLPGTAYLDLARKAGEIAAGRKVRKIRSVIWMSPLTVDSATPTEAFTELKPSGDAVAFEVFGTAPDGSKRVYCQGKLSYADGADSTADPQSIDLQAIRARCQKASDGKDIYPQFQSLGMHYGPSFQVLREVFRNDEEILGVLQLPEARNGDFQDFVLHPSLLDASMQAGVVGKLSAKAGEMLVPYSIGEVEILHPLTRTCYSYVRKAPGENTGSRLSKENVLIVDESGKVLARIRDSVGVPLTNVHGKSEFAKLFYAHTWHEAPLSFTSSDLGSIVLFDVNERLRDAYVAAGGKALLVLPGDSYAELPNSTYRINPKERNDFTQLFAALNRKSISVERICYAWPEAEGAVNKALDRGVYSFLSLCQVLAEQKLTGKAQLVYLYSGADNETQPCNEAMNGFVRSLRLEHPKILGKVVELSQGARSVEDVLQAIRTELLPETQDTITLRYNGRVRFARKLERLELPGDSQQIALREKGVYLITGGAGGLGLIFAEYLARQYQAKLVLTGRSELSRDRRAELDALTKLGAEVFYTQADVSKREDVQRILDETKARFGGINGIVHSAGVLRDSYLKKKTRQEMAAVFAPKIYGTLHLDELTRTDNLDFFVLFSSLAAVGGNTGQCDYAFANHFMDAFAARREALKAQGKRSGKTLSLNWSLWADGGMKLDEQTELFFKKTLGIKPLSKEVGLEAFVKGLSLSTSHLAVLEGVQAKIEQAWGLAKKEELQKETPIAGVAGASDVSSAVTQALSNIVMDLLKLSASDLSVESILLDLGFDSIGLSTFANAINAKYGLDLNPVLFFEHPSIAAIAQHLTADHGAAVQKAHGGGAASEKARSPIAAAVPVAFTKGWQEEAPQEKRFSNEPIAIVGIAGRMPQSDSLEEFWDHLKNERNLVTEIPRDRWVWEEHDGDPIKEVNKSNSRWGGFMKEVDKFDPLFFGILPREAEMMDPQQRIFLQTVYHAIEDSGHKVSDLSGTKTALYVGVSSNDYTDVLAKNQMALDGYSAAGNSHSILANRVSFLLNLRGPSAPIDTACSSSLIALHRAIESIHTGSSDMAIVGGVQVMLTPVGHISLSSAGMLSPQGQCKTFDKNANGYVRGEGAGAIFIKPLSKAVADGNPIYAVIKSTSENHGGRVTVLTAPNPNAQAELLLEAYEKAQVDPATVGYIECHGTGTSLGDPIEIQALKKSFGELYKKHNKTPSTPHCGLSSVKTNIGHLEPAAGIASLLKVLLAMKHREIPALLHFETLNPYIDLNGSPFYIVNKTRSWEAIQSEDGAQLPRRAGISSFGWGGANAHVVLEEFVPLESVAAVAAREPQLVVLSAKNVDRLKALVESMLTHVDQTAVDLTNFAYTLQLGRDAQEERLAVIVSSMDELRRKLRAWMSGEKQIDGLHAGRVSRGKQADFGASSDLTELANAWIKGSAVDWRTLHKGETRKRLSLPGYPFARERYWIEGAAAKKATAAGPSVSSAPANAGAAARPSMASAPANAGAAARPSMPSASTNAGGAAGSAISNASAMSAPVPPASIATIAGDLAAAVLANASNAPSREVGQVLAVPQWEASDALSALPKINYSRHQVLRYLTAERDSTRTLAERYQKTALTCFEQLQAILQSRPKEKVLFQVAIGSDGENAVLAGLSGLIRSARLESSNLIAQVILVEPDIDEKTLTQHLAAAQARPNEALLKFEGSTQSVLRWREQKWNYEPAIAFKDRGVYLITGGLGGLGVLFAQEILQRVPRARVVLTGRSELSADKQRVLDELAKKLGSGSLVYRKLDLDRLENVQALIASIVKEFGCLTGILHSAGMTHDGLIVNKTAAEFTSVLAPKVNGALHLDVATQDIDLDFIALFSSASATLGNAGQADYAAANGFMDELAHYRNALVSAGKRRGLTLSINWPLWKDGGMQLDERAQAFLFKASGIAPMSTETGLQAFHQSLALQAGQTLVLEGDAERLKQALFPAQPILEAPQPVRKAPAQKDALNRLLKTVESTLKLPIDKIDIDAHFETLGINSLILMELIQNLDQEFSVTLTPARFAEVTTMTELAALLETLQPQGVDDERDEARAEPSWEDAAAVPSAAIVARTGASTLSRAAPLAMAVSPDAQHEISLANTRAALAQEDAPIAATGELAARSGGITLSRGARLETAVSQDARPASAQASIHAESPREGAATALAAAMATRTGAGLISRSASPTPARAGDIAIVGLSCRLPDAPDARAFWTNLITAKNSVRVVPKSRWNWEDYFSAVPTPGKTVSKWGALLDDVDCFDASFFNIPPQQALGMDPQQRLLLQETYRAIEDAGINAGQLAGSNTGVFVGYQYAEYEQHLRQLGNQSMQDGPLFSSSSPSYYLSNCVSFALDLRGPSESINVNCASSAVAINRAYYSLVNGETDVAIAGGVSLNLFAGDYVTSSQYGLLSSNGTSGVFDDDAKGFSRGEGVCAVVLKRLEDAERDNDRIYAVIKSCHQNYRGAARSMSEVKHESITNVLSECYRKAAVDPETVQYIEVDGYATKWADSFEYEGIKNVFPRGLNEKRCALGSVKGNIGNVEAASGVTNLIKLALSLHHKQFPPTISKRKVSSFLDIENASHPLYIADQAIEFDAIRKAGRPVRAGINSFADSGTNVHILLEEYSADRPAPSEESGSPQLFVLSAKDSRSLAAHVNQYIDFLSVAGVAESFANLIYTLQTGREALSERLAIIAASREELVAKLSKVRETGLRTPLGLDSKDIYYGKTSAAEKNPLASLITPDMVQAQLAQSVETAQWKQIALLWTNGVAVPWKTVWQGNSAASPVSLPGYPFAKDRYWIDGSTGEPTTPVDQVPPAPEPVIVQTTVMMTQGGIEHFLRQEVARDLEKSADSLPTDRTLIELGVRSAGIVKLIHAIDTQFGTRLSPSVLFKHPEIGSLAGYLAETCASNVEAPADTLISLQTEGDKPPIFALTGAGGSALSMQQLSHALGNDQPIYCLEGAGFDRRDAAHLSVEAIAARNIDRLKPLRNAGPYRLLGHSNGGVLAFEMARQLLEQGERVASLILVDSLCPTARGQQSIHSMVAFVFNHLVRLFGGTSELTVEQLLDVPESELAAYLFSRADAGFQLTQEQFVAAFDSAIASERACRAYRPLKVSRKIETILFRAVDSYESAPADYGWGAFLRSPPRIHEIDADHFSILDRGAVLELARTIDLSATKPARKAAVRVA